LADTFRFLRCDIATIATNQSESDERDEFSFCGEMLCLERDDKSQAEI
jgi:hypothetical protein